MDEYLREPAATREKFLGEWIRTGDIGVLDERGYLYLRDRKNDMVISGGMNVYCREVEDVLARHPSVRRVAVIGIPHADGGAARDPVREDRQKASSGSHIGPALIARSDEFEHLSLGVP